MNKNFKFIDLFSGIGGFHYGLTSCGGKCVMACDIDPITKKTYEHNYGMVPLGDINEISSNSIPNFDVLCAGFPCQSFSNIGQKGGLDDPRGSLIFQVYRILKEKKPKAFILENVKGLMTIEKGEIFNSILKKTESIGYNVNYQILEAKDFELPQIRKRLFIVGIRKDFNIKFEFPTPIGCSTTLSDIMGGKTKRDYAFTIRVGGRRSGINNKFNWDCYYINGKPHYITIEECLQLQGFPKNFKLFGNESNKYKQIGNSVPTTIIREIGKKIISIGIFDKNSNRNKHNTKQ